MALAANLRHEIASLTWTARAFHLVLKLPRVATQSAVLLSYVSPSVCLFVCLSVTLVDCDHIHIEGSVT